MKYMNLEGLSHFLSKLLNKFSVLGHTHTKSEITDLIIDNTINSISENPVQNKAISVALDGKVPTSRTINGKALIANITLSASDVNADVAGTATLKSDAALADAKAYTDTKIADLVDSAPETLDTLQELAFAIQEHQDVTDALDAAIGSKVDKVSGKGLSTNDYTTTEKNKLNGIASGAEVNQNAFSNIMINTTNITADGKTDTFEIAAGSNITLVPDTTNNKVTISATDTVYTHPSYTSRTSGLYKITVNSTGHVNSVSTVTKSDITALGIPAQDTTYSNASTTAAGLMSIPDKTKLNNIPSPTTSDSGKFLRVNTSGNYALATVNNAEGVGF